MQEAKLKEAAKQKQKELHNSKQDAHHYEQQAISSMMRSLSVSEDNNVATATQLQATSPGQEAKNWSRVIDKKDQKRKQAETAKQEQEQSLPELALVRSPRTISERSIKEQTPPQSATLPTTPTTEESPSTPLSKSYNLDLSSLMPQSAKLSQKQRKRLSSESQSWRANSSANLELNTTPVAVPNAWGVTPSVPTTYPDAFSSPTQPATGSISDPTSFANMMRGQAASSINTQPEQGNSFSKILADEKRQRESYDRMRNKSLVHTQIEETAIAELREFYNVDRIDDEHITIERKSRPSNINFSTWTRH